MQTKRLIQINKKWWDIFPTLSRNQIYLALALHLKDVDDHDMVRYNRCIYGSHVGRAEKDLMLIHPYYVSYFNYNINDLKQEGKNKEQRYIKTKNEINDEGGYYKVKRTTLDIIFEEDMLNKKELLVFLYVLKLYVNPWRREYNLKISNMLKEIYPDKSNTSNYRPLVINTLDKFKSWRYDNGDVFIKDFLLSSNYVSIKLDKKLKIR